MTERKPVPKRTPDELKQLVIDVLADRLFLMQYVDEPDMVRSVFMPIGLGGLAHVEIDTIGTIYADKASAGPITVNGYPTFMEYHLVHKDDWARCIPFIQDELERRRSAEQALDEAFSEKR